MSSITIIIPKIDEKNTNIKFPNSDLADFWTSMRAKRHKRVEVAGGESLKEFEFNKMWR